MKVVVDMLGKGPNKSPVNVMEKSWSADKVQIASASF